MMEVKKTGLFLFILIAGLMSARNAAGSDDAQYWSRYLFKVYSQDKLDFSFYTEGRMYDNASWDGLYLFSPQLKYKLNKNLDVQMNYSYLQTRNSSSKAFAYQHRIEPEINPHFMVGDFMEVQLRNRMEFRCIENKGWDNTRYRGRVRLNFPVKDFGMLKSVFMDTEFFYDISGHDHSEERTTPLGVNLKITKKTGLQLFYMIQNQDSKGNGDWLSNEIAGSMITVEF